MAGKQRADIRAPLAAFVATGHPLAGVLAWQTRASCGADLFFHGKPSSGWKTKRRKPAVPPKLPREIALEELGRISAEIEKMSPYQFSIRVSDILRKYVTQQYGLPATRQTSIEFLTALAKVSPFSAEEKSLLEDFLNRCDLIKFARYEGTTSDSELLLGEAIRFVKGGELAAV